MPAARAFQTAITNVGDFINPGDGAHWLDLTVDFVVVGVDGTFKRLTGLHVNWDPGDTIPNLQAAMRTAVVAAGGAFGFTFAANTILCFDYAKA